jgi:hypothetical protein
VTAPRWAARALLALAAALVPWTIVLGATLPKRQVVHHWDVAWVGFDVALIVTLAATAVALLTGHPFGRLLAPVIAALLLCDAWFDVVTSAGDGAEFWFAVALALVAEIPLAAFCLWLTHAVHVSSA